MTGGFFWLVCVMDAWLIGIDDTDMPGTRGTGRLARMLSAELAARGVKLLGVTRHQLLLHPDVPYTSHNSCACVAVEIADGRGLFDWICGFVAENSPQGADPGVCMIRAEKVGACVIEFGCRAQCELVALSEARDLGATEACLHAGLGGTNDGMIGSLAAVGLRASGADGRFIELGKIRDIQGRTQVRILLDAGIDALCCEDAEKPESADWVETFGWVRPRLYNGCAVLFVKRDAENGADWVTAGQRKGDRKER